MNYNRLLNFVSEIGCELLESGAETYRVEETMRRIGIAYGVHDTEVFAVPTCIILSLTPPDAQTVTKARRIRARTTDLNRIDRINALCRSLCDRCSPLEEAEQLLGQIRAEKPYSFAVRLFGAAMVAMSCTLFFGGNFADACCALVIGAVLQAFSAVLQKGNVNAIFINIVGGGAIALLAMAAVQMGLGQHTDKMIIGALMNFVPGVALTNSMRDLIAGDFVAGQTRLTEALLTATCIALGAGAALSLMRLFG